MNELLNSHVKSATRVLDLFELLGRQDRAMSHSDIAEMLDIPKSSLTQLLKTLSARGYIRYDPSVKAYCIGDTFSQLISQNSLQQNVADLAMPFLRTMTAQLKETSDFHILKDNMVEVVASTPASQMLLSSIGVGQKVPLYATASGKVILAFLPEDQQEEYIKSVDLEPLTAKTARTKAELRKAIKLVRKNNYAFCSEEFVPGVNGLAVPVVTQAGKLIGALMITVPTVRYNAAFRDKALTCLRDSAYKIRKQLDIVHR